MKYLLIMHMNPGVREALSDHDREAVYTGHERFQRAIRETGEMISTQALADPENSAVVRVRDGVPVVTDGPYLDAADHLAGYYLVDCESRDRALELAAVIPDARVLGVEVRPVMDSSGMEM